MKSTSARLLLATIAVAGCNSRRSAGGGVITYRTGGKQRIAIAEGLEDRILDTHGQPVVVAFGL